MDLGLDCRPRLLPAAVLLRRSPTELQIGLDPGWRLPDPAGRWHQTLEGLDGRRSWRRIVADDRSVDPGALARLLESLAGVGLAELGSASAPARRRGGRVRLVGTGPLATAAGSRLRDAGIEVTSNRTTVDLTVVAPDALEADRTTLGDLVRHDVPHLLVRSGPAGATVGPLVAPGRTACLHCGDLTRRDADPAWPRLLEQLQRRSIDACPAPIADWAVSTAVTQTLGFLAGIQPETYGATVETGAPAYALVWRSWSPHRECGCHWLRSE